jgi:hypothetical protein
MCRMRRIFLFPLYMCARTRKSDNQQVPDHSAQSDTTGEEQRHSWDTSTPPLSLVVVGSCDQLARLPIR